jgi:hypothetical protein
VAKIFIDPGQALAAGIDNLTAEHIMFAHPDIMSHLCILFKFV